jgi:hypothetical protein
MTTYIRRIMIDVGGVMLRRRLADVAKARDRATCTWPAVVGFAVGCRAERDIQGGNRLRSVALPAKARSARGCAAMTANLEGGQDS